MHMHTCTHKLNVCKLNMHDSCTYCVYVLQSLSNKIASKLESDFFSYEEAQVFYLKLKGDYYRYLTKNVEGVTREGNMCKNNLC